MSDILDEEVIESDTPVDDSPIDVPTEPPVEDSPVEEEPQEPVVPEDTPVESDGKTGETPFIELIVETGMALDDANSYASLEFARNYALTRGYEDVLSLDDNELKKILIRGTDYVDHIYKYRGKKCTAQQALSFPRKNLIDDDGFEIDGIPLNLKKAVVEAAKLVRTQETLFITKNKDGKVKRKKVDVLETEFFESKDASLEYSTIYEVLNSLLDGLYRTDSEKLTYNVGAMWIDD